MIDLSLNPVGIVHSPYTPETRKKFDDRNSIVAEIEIFKEFEPALFRLDNYDELWILFWFNRIEPEERHILQVHPMHNPNNPIRGVFSTRSPARPNPIGLTRVKLLELKDNIITVKGLEAFNDTIILDIKEA